MIKIGIHQRKGSFSDFWISYCEAQKIPYKIVDCYKDNIVDQVSDCDVVMWHHHHGNYKDNLFAKQLLYSLEQAGKKIFPDFNTNWHFDDKVGQKYLLELIRAPLVPSFVFYDKHSALAWAATTDFPKVFKLRGGAGAANVQLASTRKQCNKLINKAFGRGFSQFNRWGHLTERWRKVREGTGSVSGVLKSIGRLFLPTEFARMQGREKGYVYFQEYMPDNNFDIRVIVIGEKAFAIKRMVRKNDFRASGSGHIVHAKEEIDPRCVAIAFATSEALKTQCIAYDFVFDKDKNPLIVEISYGFDSKGYFDCEGYWDKNLNWFKQEIQPQSWVIEGIISSGA